MAGRGVVILTIGLIALVLLVMPNAIAKFSGQHEFINGSNVDCGKCHATEHTALSSKSDAHINMSCMDCHIPNNSSAADKYYNPYQSSGTTATASYHAAALVECLYCHGDLAGNTTRFGRVIPAANVTEELLSDTAAHKPFFLAANASDLLAGANEACIACHTPAATNTTVTISATKLLNITANYTACTTGTNCYNGWEISIGST